MRENIDSRFEENVLDEFASWLRLQGKADATVKTYLSVIGKFQLWLISIEKNLNDISHEDVQEYMDFLENQQKNAGTIEKYLAAISVFVKFLGTPDKILNIQIKEKDNRANEMPEYLTDNEISNIISKLEATQNERNVAIFYTLLHTGIRISELCSLNLEDIEIAGGKGKLTVINDGEVDRIVPLSRDAVKHLQEYLDTLETEEGPLFLSSVNKRISARGVQYMLDKYEVNPHKLRHTFCRQLITKGIDINTVAKLAGHKDVNVTKRYIMDIQPNLEQAIDQAF